MIVAVRKFSLQHAVGGFRQGALVCGYPATLQFQSHIQGAQKQNQGKQEPPAGRWLPHIQVFPVRRNACRNILRNLYAQRSHLLCVDRRR